MSVDSIGIALRVAISCIVFAIFVFVPLKSRFRYGNLKTGLLVSSLIVVTIAVTILFLTPGNFWAEYSTFGIILWIICAVLIFRISIKGSYFEIFFIVLVVLNLYANIMTISKLVVSMLDWNIPVHMARAVVATGVMILYMPLLWILMFRVYKPAIEFQIDFSSWRFIWIIPALTYMIFYVKIIGDYWRKPMEAEVGDVVFSILWSLCSYVFFCVALLVLIRTYNGISAMEQTNLITSQLRMQEEQYQQLVKNIEHSAQLRHDWRHQLLTINGLAEEGKTEELNRYLRDLMPAYLKEGESPVCQNYVVNIILQHYASMAEKQGITMIIMADVPRSPAIPEMDLCIIFGNLVENAVEACMGQTGGRRSIDIKAATKGRQLVIMIKNTYEQEITVKGGIYYSTKHEGAGIGLSSVKRVVEKNRGYMTVEYGNGCFGVNIILNAG